VGFVSVSYSIFQSSSTVSETNTHIYNRHRFSRRRQKKTKRKLIFKSFSTFNIINQYLLSDLTQIDNSNKLKQFPSYEILRLTIDSNKTDCFHLFSLQKNVTWEKNIYMKDQHWNYQLFFHETLQTT